MIRLHHARGSRSMRVKWLLEELGTAYEIELVNFAEMSKPDYLKIHPFARIPALQDGDLTLFESGAIVEYSARSGRGAGRSARSSRFPSTSYSRWSCCRSTTPTSRYTGS